MKAALFSTGKKPPSPVTPPRSSSLAHLNSQIMEKTGGHRAAKPKSSNANSTDGYDSDSSHASTSYYNGAAEMNGGGDHLNGEKISPKPIFSTSMEWPQHKPIGGGKNNSLHEFKTERKPNPSLNGI